MVSKHLTFVLPTPLSPHRNDAMVSEKQEQFAVQWTVLHIWLYVLFYSPDSPTPNWRLVGDFKKKNLRGWSPKFETGINIIIKSALYSIFWQDSITNIKINSFQIFWRLCDPFYWEYTKDLLGVYFGYTGGIFGLYLSYSGAILELYWGYLILGV